MIHISDNVEESKRTLDTVNNYNEFTVKNYVRKGYKPVIKENNKCQNRSYISLLKELRDDCDER